MKTGIVGCGSIAQIHAAVLSEMSNVTLVGAADILPQRAQLLCENYGGNFYSSLGELLANESLDVLHICTPHALHVPMAESASKAGVAVFTEKPPAISKLQWDQLCGFGKKIPIGVCFQNRYNDSVQYIKKILTQEKLGAFLGAKAFLTWQRDANYYTESGWRGKWASEGGGVLINQAIHTMDLLVHFLGRPDSVQAHMHNYHLSDVIEVEDTLEAYIEYGKSPVLFYATNGYAVNSPVMLEMIFEAVTIHMEETEVTLTWSDGRKEIKNFLPEEVQGKSYWGNGHRRCIYAFYEALENAVPPPLELEQVHDTVDLVLGTYHSAKIHKKVLL